MEKLAKLLVGKTIEWRVYKEAPQALDLFEEFYEMSDDLAALGLAVLAKATKLQKCYGVIGELLVSSLRDSPKLNSRYNKYVKLLDTTPVKVVNIFKKLLLGTGMYKKSDRTKVAKMISLLGQSFPPLAEEAMKALSAADRRIAKKKLL